MKPILVTGAGGFVGSHLQKAMVEKGLQVQRFSRSECDLEDTKSASFFDGFEISRVVHLAARTNAIESWGQGASEYLRSNFLMTLSALEIARRHQVPFTFVSSYVYGEASGKVNENAPRKPHNPYSASKIQSEDLCFHYHDLFDLPITVIRPFSVFGPQQASHQLIPTLFREIFQDSRTFTVRSLSPRRDFIYILDVVELIVKSFELEGNKNVFNAGSGKLVSVSELTEKIMELSGVQKVYSGNTAHAVDEIETAAADTSTAKEILGWTPTYSLEEGLRRTLLAR